MVKHEKVGPNVQFLNPLSTGDLHQNSQIFEQFDRGSNQNIMTM